MAESSCMWTRPWMVWKTQIPFSNVKRTSPKFLLLGAECFLQLSVGIYRAEDCYVVTLCKAITTKRFQDTFRVETCIEHPEHDIRLCNSTFKYVNSAEEELLRERVKKISENVSNFETCGQLKILCLFHVSQAPVLESKLESSIGVQACLDVSPSLENLSLDLSNLLEREALPDVKLRCGDRTTSAHRCILAARSEVFAAMFRNKMAESETGIIDVTDMDAAVLALFMKYVYSGKIPDLSEDIAQTLYAAGDKYAMHTLKRSCSECMVGGLTKENCLGFLTLAEAHSDEDFKNTVIDFVSEHLRVLGSEPWSRFKNEHPRLSLEIYDRHFAATASSQSSHPEK